MLEFICEHNASFSTKIYIILKMVNKAICNQISDFAFDVHYSGVQVVDVVPVRAEEHVVGVLSLPVLQCTVGLMRQVQDVQQRWIRLRQYLNFVCHSQSSYTAWLNNVASWASTFLAY